MSRKTQATLVLCLMAIGFIGTYSLDSFWGNLINHGFLAAVIGGLADWFAVTALFRKPLGFISYRTEILPRNRERIMDELVIFIGKDLLNPQYIISNLKNYDMAIMVVEYANKLGGRGKLKFAIRELILQVISTLDTPKIAKSLAVALKSRRKNFNMARFLVQFLCDFLNTPAGDKLLDSLIKLVRTVAPDLIKSEFVTDLIERNVDIIRKEYTKDKSMRELMFDMIDLSSDNLTNKLMNLVNDYSDKLLDYDSAERSRLKTLLSNKIELLGKRDGYKLKVAQLEHYFFVKKFDFTDNLTVLIDNFCKNEQNKNDLLAKVDTFIDNAIDDLAQDKAKQQRLNEWFMQKLSDFIQNNSQWVLDYLKGELMKYSQDEFVELVEKRVGDDLQMIRINGSIVGAIAGMGLYVLSFVIERLCGI